MVSDLDGGRARSCAGALRYASAPLRERRRVAPRGFRKTSPAGPSGRSETTPERPGDLRNRLHQVVWGFSTRIDPGQADLRGKRVRSTTT